MMRTALVFVLCCAFPLSALAAATAGHGLEEFLMHLPASEVVPGADRFGPVSGQPAIAPAYRGKDLAGYAYLNSDIVDAVGYSGKPIQIVVGLDPEGTIVGLKLVHHSEPILLIGIPESRVIASLSSLIGYNPIKATAQGREAPQADIVSGAIVTVLVMGESVVRSAVRVARMLGLGEPVTTTNDRRVIDPDAGEIGDWQTLLGEGAIRRRHLSKNDVDEAFRRRGDLGHGIRPDYFFRLVLSLRWHKKTGCAAFACRPSQALPRRMYGPEKHIRWTKPILPRCERTIAMVTTNSIEVNKTPLRASRH